MEAGSLPRTGLQLASWSNTPEARSRVPPPHGLACLPACLSLPSSVHLLCYLNRISGVSLRVRTLDGREALSFLPGILYMPGIGGLPKVAMSVSVPFHVLVTLSH